MKFAVRPAALVSILSASMICSCGKKEESKPADAPPAAAAAAKPESSTSTAAPAPAKEAPPPATEAKAPAAPATTPAAPAAGEREFTGTVGGQPIIMGLAFQNEAGGRAEVSGWYLLESVNGGGKLPLSGKFQDGTLALDQTVNGAVTGSFEITATGGGAKTYLGSWKGLGKVLPVKITER